MQQFRIIFFPLVLVVSVLVMAACDRLGLDSDEETASESSDTKSNETQDAVADSQNWAKQDKGQANTSLGFAGIQRVFANLNANQKSAYLENGENFKQFVQQEANNLSVLAAARENKVDKDEKTVFLMQRSAENILRESYLNKLIAGKLPADFPTDQQIQEYFDNNESSFFLEARVHVWQIFLRIDDAMDNVKAASIEQQAKSTHQDILNKKIDFADAAMQFSEHVASKANGGYMGLVKVSELIPGLAGPLMDLPEGQLSGPVRSDSGIHILKRGAIIPKQDVSFGQVKNQIRGLLIKQASAKLRRAIYNQAGKTYPIDLNANILEKWRLRLRTNL